MALEPETVGNEGVDETGIADLPNDWTGTIDDIEEMELAGLIEEGTADKIIEERQDSNLELWEPSEDVVIFLENDLPSWAKIENENSVHYNVGWSQGDGVAWDGTIDLAELAKERPELMEQFPLVFGNLDKLTVQAFDAGERSYPVQRVNIEFDGDLEPRDNSSAHERLEIRALCGELDRLEEVVQDAADVLSKQIYEELSDQGLHVSGEESARESLQDERFDQWGEIAVRSKEDVRAMASSPQTAPEVLHALSKDAILGKGPSYFYADRIAEDIAANPSSPIEALRVVRLCDNANIRSSLWAHPNADLHLLASLSEDRIRTELPRMEAERTAGFSSHEALEFSMEKAAIAEKGAYGLLKSGFSQFKEPSNALVGLSPIYRDALAACESTPPDILGSLGCLSPRNVGSNPSTPKAALLQLSVSSEEYVRLDVAKNPSTTPDILQSMGGEKVAMVRVALASNPRMPSEVLDGFVLPSRENPPMVRQAAALNPSISEGALSRLAKDNDRSVSLRAKEALTGRACVPDSGKLAAPRLAIAESGPDIKPGPLGARQMCFDLGVEPFSTSKERDTGR